MMDVQTLREPIVYGLAHELGEQQRSFSEIDNLDAFLSAHRIPRKPEVYGWGHHFASSRSVLELGVASAKRTLATSGTDPAEVDLVIFCCIHFPDDKYRSGAALPALLGELRTYRALPIGVTLNNCLTLLSALSLAGGMVAAGRARTALVISADKVAGEFERIHPFAIFSDAAVSCLVTNDESRRGYRIVAESFHQDPALEAGATDMTQRQLYRRVAETLTARCGRQIGEAQRIFTSNLFRPLVLLKETQPGWASREQLYLENVARVGHCNSGDPLLNLETYASETAPQVDDLFILAADAPGLRGALMLSVA